MEQSRKVTFYQRRHTVTSSNHTFFRQVTPGSIAATGLSTDDVILRIGESDTSSLTYAQAMDVIKNSGNLLQLCISKWVGEGEGGGGGGVCGDREAQAEA